MKIQTQHDLIDLTDLMTTEELSRACPIPVGTLRYWRASGEGPPSVKLGRRVYYPRSGVARWLREQQQRDAERRIYRGAAS